MTRSSTSPFSSNILPTKLTPPHTAESFIPRQELEIPMDWLSGRYRIATFVAPAGYGKTSVMSAWFRELKNRGEEVAWLSLDGEDNDPARFLSYLASSIGGGMSRSNNMMSQDSIGGNNVSLLSIVDSLIAKLSVQTEPISIFIDDLHLIEDPQTLLMMQRVSTYAPPNVGLVIGSRIKPPLSLISLQIKHQVLELGVEDLRFSETEAKQLLSRIIGITPATETINNLIKRTEGWPAALQLASLSIRNGENIDELVKTFNGTDRQLCDYLSESVLYSLPQNLRTFMIKISVLDHICGDLCKAVTGCNASQSLLENLEDRSLFLIPLDRKREWYRYHHLFSDYLRRHLSIEKPDQIEKLHMRAALWFREQGSVEEAINHALYAKEYDSASEWIAECAEELVQNHGAHTTLLRWMQRLPEHYISRWPAIRLNRAWSLGFNRQFDESERELEKVEAYCNQSSSSDPKELVNILCALQLQRVVNAALSDDAQKSRQLSERWLDDWPDAAYFLKGTAHVVLGFGCNATGEVQLGLKHLTTASKNFKKCDGYYGIAWASMVSAVLLAKYRRLQDAISVCEEGVEYTSHHLGRENHGTQMLYALMAAMHYQRNEIEKSTSCLQPDLTYLKEQASVDPLIAGFQTMARLQTLQGKYREAHALLSEGVELAEVRNLPRLASNLRGEIVILHLRQQRNDLAFDEASLATTEHQHNSTKDGYMVDTCQWKNIEARLALVENRTDDALSILHHVIGRVRRLGRQWRLIESFILKAIAYQQKGMEREAQRAFNESVSLGRTEGYLRIFLDEGPSVRQLVESALAVREDSVAPESDPNYFHIKKLSEAFKAELNACSEDRLGSYVCSTVTLTSQEERILHLISSGQSNGNIAQKLFISTGTVKWHLHNIYGKLSVGNRFEAVARARSLGLL